MPKLTQEQVVELFTCLINSTVEGQTGQWDAGSEEGREGFYSMREDLCALADHFGVELPKDKIKEVKED